MSRRGTPTWEQSNTPTQPDDLEAEVREALRNLAGVPAVLQVLGRDHTDNCKCPLCRAREALAATGGKLE